LAVYIIVKECAFIWRVLKIYLVFKIVQSVMKYSFGGCFRNGSDGRQCGWYGLLFQQSLDFCYGGIFPGGMKKFLY
jgi:hypothetical protein